MSDERLRQLAREIAHLGLPIQDAFSHLAEALGLANYRIEPAKRSVWETLGNKKLDEIVANVPFEIPDRKAWTISWEEGTLKFILRRSEPRAFLDGVEAIHNAETGQLVEERRVYDFRMSPRAPRRPET